MSSTTQWHSAGPSYPCGAERHLWLSRFAFCLCSPLLRLTWGLLSCLNGKHCLASKPHWRNCFFISFHLLRKHNGALRIFKNVKWWSKNSTNAWSHDLPPHLLIPILLYSYIVCLFVSWISTYLKKKDLFYLFVYVCACASSCPAVHVCVCVSWSMHYGGQKRAWGPLGLSLQTYVGTRILSSSPHDWAASTVNAEPSFIPRSPSFCTLTGLDSLHVCF